MLIVRKGPTSHLPLHDNDDNDDNRRQTPSRSHQQKSLAGFLFLGTRVIDRKISARHVFNRRYITASLFRLCNTKQFLHRCSWSRVVGTKKFNPHSTLIMMPRNAGIGSPSYSSCGHDSSIFLKSYDESETTSCMHFVATLYIFGLRLTIQKKMIS